MLYFLRVRKTGFWKKEKALSGQTAVAQAEKHLVEERGKLYDVNSTVSLKTGVSAQSRKEKGTSVVGSELPFDLTKDLFSESQTF